jgi:hypothetical protein
MVRLGTISSQIVQLDKIYMVGGSAYPSDETIEVGK